MVVTLVVIATCQAIHFPWFLQLPFKLYWQAYCPCSYSKLTFKIHTHTHTHTPIHQECFYKAVVSEKWSQANKAVFFGEKGTCVSV